MVLLSPIDMIFKIPYLSLSCIVSSATATKMKQQNVEACSKGGLNPCPAKFKLMTVKQTKFSWFNESPFVLD